ncbi:hypothetical protein QG37_03102 [Candidozyma auris]|nr:hypothetical protein QG37_03102 [[Candida] auris]
MPIFLPSSYYSWGNCIFSETIQVDSMLGESHTVFELFNVKGVVAFIILWATVQCNVSLFALRLSHEKEDCFHRLE